MPMARTQEFLAPEIVDRGIKQSGLDAGSPTFSVRIHRGLPDFLNSVNLKYVKLGYGYLINHGMYLMGMSILLAAFGTQVGKLTWDVRSFKYYNSANTIHFLGFLCLFVYLCLDLTPRCTYLVDFACYLPPNELKITKEEYIELAKKSGQFNDTSIKFQERVLKNSGLGDETYLPRVVFQPGYRRNLKQDREEAAAAMFATVDELFAATGIRSKDIRILVVNCGVLNTTPLSRHADQPLQAQPQNPELQSRRHGLRRRHNRGRSRRRPLERLPRLLRLDSKHRSYQLHLVWWE
ncbi:3-ketoacyl-CoA synthase 10 [Sesamum alatum]|uniref:3-ketoacyl-CoA synthase 10 n=1 Tax=Sesamum alatum TaxID=300844 RepID=A0AAE1YM46_9LAMI|nr:3-ketoacyl-CoA synthase 10 [Sesamum alatum]